MGAETQEPTLPPQQAGNREQQPTCLTESPSGNDSGRDAGVHPGDWIALYILLGCMLLIVAMNIWDFMVGMLSQ